jgi:hypothetical protein
MTERIQTRQRNRPETAAHENPGPGTDPDVMVTTGLYADSLPVAGMTVSEVRRRFADRLNIDPAATAVLDGHAADETVRLRAGQVLSFVRAAGEKGTGADDGEQVTIHGDAVEAVSPEGATAAMPLGSFLEALRPDLPSTSELVTPDGVRLMFSTRRITIVAWEIPPAVHRVRWISGDSAAPYSMGGRRAKYRERRLALPYLEIFAVFHRDGNGRLALSSSNELYFRSSPLKHADDELYFPALLNVSRFNPDLEDSRPLSWICTQHLDRRALAAEPDANRRFRNSLEALRSMILEAAFNFSSEHHEMTSYWTLSAKKIPEVADLDRWERLSAEDPLFVLGIPWLPAEWEGKPLTARVLARRITRLARAAETSMDSAAGLARIVFNHAGAGTCQTTATGS